jgi:hypothetical protein
VTQEVDERPRSWSCRLRVETEQPDAAPFGLRLRVPAWAEAMVVTDAQGKPVASRREGGYCRIAMAPGQAHELLVTLSWNPRVEDRRLTRLKLDSSTLQRYRGVVLLDGPRLLLANVNHPRPTLVATVGKDGSLCLPAAADGIVRIPTVPNADATPSQIADAVAGTPRLALAPWDRVRRDAAVAFVFDLITNPEK